jgi:thiol-disulfide isomerase/thioredoxin
MIAVNTIELRGLNGTVVRLDSIRTPLCAIVFLSPECPLCKNYSLTLHQLQEKYNSSLFIAGIFPGKDDDSVAYAGFVQENHVRFPLWRDEKKELADAVKATVTPEVFLFDSSRQLLYSGAIDNWLVRLGATRHTVTENYLEDAIGHFLDKTQITTVRTKAIGCFIN